MKKGNPLRDGSGQGKRLNAGRGGCAKPRQTGKQTSRPITKKKIK